MADKNLPRSEIILYTSEDGQTRVQCRLGDETIWLTQKLIAELFQVTPQNVTLHLKAIYEEGEIDEAATCKGLLTSSIRRRPGGFAESAPLQPARHPGRRLPRTKPARHAVPSSPEEESILCSREWVLNLHAEDGLPGIEVFAVDG